MSVCMASHCPPAALGVMGVAKSLATMISSISSKIALLGYF